MSWSNRGGSNFGASLNLTDGMGNSNTIGFKSYHGDLGSHTEFKSEFTPPNIYQQVRMGTMGIDPSKNSSALTLHNLCSMAILYGTSPKRLNGVLDKAAQIAIAVAMQKVRQDVAIGITSTVTGTILAKKGIDDTQKIFDKKTGLGSTTGMPDPDDEDEKPELMTNSKHHPNSESPQPSNFKELYKNSVADDKGVRWAMDKQGTLHRFSAPRNNLTHWNGSTAGKDPITLDTIPIQIRRLFKIKG